MLGKPGFSYEMAEQTTKITTKRRKFKEVDIPLIRDKKELLGSSLEEINNKTITLDLTRQLKGKSVEATVKVRIENEKAVAYPIKIKLMPYFIKRMIRKNISYVEDSFEAPSQESMFRIKPFLITRKKVSRVIRKTLRNRAKNWIEDYIAGEKDNDIFNSILSNRFQKALSLSLKKTYPLSLCEIRILEIKRPLRTEEIPKITKPKKEEIKEEGLIEVGLDQLKEIEDEKIRKAEEEIKKTQEKVAEIEETISREDASQKPLGVGNKEPAKEKVEKPKKEKKTKAKKE